MKNALSIILLAGFIGFSVYATHESGEWSIGKLIFNLFLTGMVSGFFLLIASLCTKSEMKIIVGIVYFALMAAYIDRVGEVKIRNDRLKAAQQEKYRQYMNWYNSLSPYQKLEHDNERLREENALLESTR